MLTVSSVVHKEWLEDKVSLDYYEFFADEDSDLPTGGEYTPDEPTDITYKIAQGSMGYVISTSTMYLLSSEGSWVEQESSGGGGGGGGTTNYEQLSHKPQINGTTLSGNKSLSDLGIAAAADIPSVPVQSVSKNGTAITPSAQGNVNIIVPTQASDVNALSSDTKYAGSATQGGSATSAAKLDTASAGSATQPVYFTNGVPTATTYSLEKSVPSNAVFTDTTYTLAAGTGDDANKVVLTPSSGSAQKITVPYATSAGSASSASAVAWSGVSSKPSTLSGYGITDAKIANGVVTLGANTITPLTSHQSVTDNSPTLAWSTKSKVATIGSTDIHVTMPAQPSYTASDVGLGNVTNNAQVKKISSAVSGDIVTWSGTDGATVADSGVKVQASSTAMDGTSDAQVPTSKNIKTNVTKTAVLTDYTKSTTAKQALATTDTVNSAFGKIEKRVSDNENNILNIETQNRNKLPYTLDTLKALNTTGTWTNNVYTINNLSFTVNADMSISVALVSGDTPTATYFYLCPISDLKIGNATYIGYARYNNQNVDYSTTNYFGLYGISGVANLILNAGVDIPSDYASRYTHAIIRISAALSPQYQLWKPVIEDKTLYTAGITSYIPYTPSNRELYDNLGGSDYIVTASGRRLYISDSAPTGEIPAGSIGVGW